MRTTTTTTTTTFTWVFHYRYLTLSLIVFFFNDPCIAFYIDRQSPTEFRNQAPLFLPVVVEGTLDLDICDQWMDHVLARSGQEIVNVQRHFGIQQKALKQAIEVAVANSRHADGIYVTSKSEEGSSCSTDQLPWYDVQEELFTDLDWFPYLAYHTIVSDTLVISGNGGSSQLKCHPWTTTNTCLDGYQLWRLLPPNHDTLLSPQPATTTQWGNHRISMGSISTRNLFEFRHMDVPDDWSEWTDEEKWYEMQDLAELPERIRPNVNVDGLFYSTVTTAGDSLVIPPGWWHQSYGLEPSMSLASLRCGTKVDVPQLIQQLLTGTKKDDIPVLLGQNSFADNEDEAVEVIKAIFEFLDERECSSS